MPNSLVLTLFGSPEVRNNGQLVTGFRSSKAQALLYYLAVTGRPHTRPTLTGLLWGDQPETAARVSLSKCLSNLHELLGDALLIDRQTVSFNRSIPYQLDIEAFAEGVSAPVTDASAHTLQVALTLYRGDFLEGFYVRGAPDFEQWLLGQRAQYRENVLQGLHALAAYAEQEDHLPQAISHTRRLLTLEPWREEAHRQLMRLLAASGQRAAALAQYETCRRILDEELAVEPDVETVALVEAIRAGEFDRMTGGRGDKVNVALDRSVPVSPPPLVTPPLPIPPTPLIGRERELAELGELIDNPQCKLITITGPGGIGKTRLALAAAADQSGKFQHGAIFVPLAGISSAQFLPQAILSALNVPLQGDLSPQQQVRAVLYNQERLLVLDNYEHLLPDIDLLLDMLHHAPQTTLLVTSRERLALQAEHLHELAGLEYPPSPSRSLGARSSGDWLSYMAVQLFLQRVRQTQPRFAPGDEELAAMVRICHITEGMPLALELAAAGIREQSCVALATALQQGQARLTARLRDLPERHRTIEAVFEYSWRLLSVTEQQGLAALSVFRGGFATEAAQEIATATPTMLATLVDKSWLRRNGAGRYDIHELVRQYAHEQLVASGAFPAIHAGYTRYFLDLSEAASAGLGGSQPSAWMARVEQEIDNLRAVLQGLITHRPEEGLQMTLNLFWLWQSTNYLQEGCEWLASALAHNESASPFLRASAYIDAGFLAICMNRIAEAEKLLAHSFALYQTLDTSDPQVAEGLASVLNRQSLAPLFQGDYAETLRLTDQALVLARQSGSQREAASALFFGAEALYHQGFFVQAQCRYEESLKLKMSMVNPRSSGRTLMRLGHVACALSDLTEAIAFFHRALQAAVDCRDQPGVCFALIGLARTAAAQGDYQRATALLAAKEEIVAINPIARFWPMDRKVNEETLTTIHAHLDDATFATAWAKGIAMSLEQAIAYALAESSNA
jgi:predicted ATPase/DNA-binding SARP family transcriptional activator